MGSGVPQGSVLEPLIFLLTIESINDLDLAGNLGLFADDTQAGMAVSCEADAWRLQLDLATIGVWSGNSNMKFNCSKFECLKSGFNQELKVQNDYITPDMEFTIEMKDNIKDLGIRMSNSGDFSYYILKVISQVKQWIS